MRQIGQGVPRSWLKILPTGQLRSIDQAKIQRQTILAMSMKPNDSEHCNQSGVSVSTNIICSDLIRNWVLPSVITSYALLYKT